MADAQAAADAAAVAGGVAAPPPAPPAAAGVPAAPPAPTPILRHVLQVVGQFTDTQYNHFVSKIGDLSARLLAMPHSKLEQVIKILNDSLARTDNTRRLGFMQLDNLESSIFAAMRLAREGKVLTHSNWNTDALDRAAELKTEWKFGETCNETLSLSSIPAGPTGFQEWYDSSEAKAASVRSSSGTSSIMYIFRRNKPAGWNPETDAADEDERHMYSIVTQGPYYRNDNKLVFLAMKTGLAGQDCWQYWQWCKPFERSSDGMAALAALRQLHEGDDARIRRLAVARTVLNPVTGVKFTSEYTLSFDKVVTKLEGAYRIQETDDTAQSDEAKVRHLIDNVIQCKDKGNIGNACYEVKRHHSRNWMSAISTIADEIPEAFPPRTPRVVNELNRGLGRGRGRDRRSRGGRGRGRGGRGGRGGGRGRGYANRVDFARHSGVFNGVDVKSDPWKYFSDDEMTKMGTVGVKYMFYLRDKHYDDGDNDDGKRDISEVNVETDGNDANGSGDASGDASDRPEFGQPKKRR